MNYHGNKLFKISQANDFDQLSIFPFSTKAPEISTEGINESD